MAWLLVGLTKYDNVRLYPSIIGPTLTKLIETSDIYLDINYGSKEDEVIQRLISKNVPMYSFDGCKSHGLNYHIFEDGQVIKMADKFRRYTSENKKTNIKVRDISE